MRAAVGGYLSFVLVAEYVALGLVVVYQLVERGWRRRVLRRAARHMVVGPASLEPPTALDVRAAEVLFAGAGGHVGQDDAHEQHC